MTALQQFPSNYFRGFPSALMRSFISLSTSMPTAVNATGVAVAYPHITRSSNSGGAAGLPPSPTALNDDTSAFLPGRNFIHPLARHTDLSIAGRRIGRNPTKRPLRRTWITEPQTNRINRARAALEGGQHG